MLCTACRGVLQYNFHVISRGEEDMKILVAGHHPSPMSLLHAVDAGCWLCTKFWFRISAEKKANMRSSTTQNLDFEAGLPPREQDDDFAMMTRGLSWASWCTTILIMDGELVSKETKSGDLEMLVTVVSGNKVNEETAIVTMQSMEGRTKEGRLG